MRLENDWEKLSNISELMRCFENQKKTFVICLRAS